ncbi:MAG: Ni/Fe-hydrogenase, b-type cytochrome subunit [Vicinamibacterales bacterium]
MATTTFERVYIWERPVRLYHWTTALGMVTLIATGFLIGAPLALMSSGDASSSFWFGTVRMLHFAAGFIVTFALVIRVYWMFAGNQYAKWNNFFPITPTLFKKALKGTVDVVKVDLLQIQVKPIEVEGHNAMAALSYAGIFLLTIFMIVTGLALYADMSDWWFPQLFAWVTPIMGGDASVRMWHHLATWAFVIFTMIHVYLCVYHDYVEGHGEISSMVAGSKFIEKRG